MSKESYLVIIIVILLFFSAYGVASVNGAITPTSTITTIERSNR